MKEVFPVEKLGERITRDRFFGKYQHNLCVHAPLQYRLVNGETINCEDEERCFNMIKNITKDTINYKPGHVVGNLIVRQEVESQCHEKYEFDREINSTLQVIRKIGKKVEEDQYNSLFTYDYIQKNSADWQAHLQRIADFLIFDKNIWWQETDFGIEFFDFINHPWLSILDNNICIPTHEILEGNEDEKVSYRKTTFLSDKILNYTSPSSGHPDTLQITYNHIEYPEHDIFFN